jgi:peroxiredoxin
VELYALQAVIDEIEDLGASLVALTPQLPEHSRAMVEKHGLTFDLLSDPGNEYAAALGIRFEVPADLKEVYRSFGIALDRHNGDDSWTLPMPGRFVIDSTGIVRHVDVDPDYTRRPEPAASLAELERLE